MKSNNGFQTKVWGPPAWLFLHVVSLNYRKENAKQYKIFFESLKHVLPCGACRENYGKILKEMPMNANVMKSRYNLAAWLFRVHNEVANDIYKKTNQRENKPLYKNSKKDFEKVAKFYEQFRAKCMKNAYGCVVPQNGTRKMAKITIVPFKGKRSKIDMKN